MAVVSKTGADKVKSWLDAAMAKCTAMDGGSPLTCIADDEPLSQYGKVESRPNTPVFRSRRRENEPGLSLLKGTLTAAEIARRVLGRSGSSSKDRVRHTTAGKLRKAGFAVIHTPTQVNQKHCSVVLLNTDDGLDYETEWSDDVSSRFDECFIGGQ